MVLWLRCSVIQLDIFMGGDGNSREIGIEFIKQAATKSVTRLWNQPKVTQYPPEILSVVKNFAYSIVHVSILSNLLFSRGRSSWPNREASPEAAQTMSYSIYDWWRLV